MTEDLARQVVAGERRALARAITLVESSREDHRADALVLLRKLAPLRREGLRIGLSGAPGVGKSTFIETFGLMLTGLGLKVAVLAIDPSSDRSGGSILGDKTRMERLSREKAAFIRPSPNRGSPGGVARRTCEAVTLCEAAGHDAILIETVGVGQSETVAAELCDVFILLIAPAGGDELQGVKRGIMEVADLILVNKADGDTRAAAARTRADYAGALRLLRKRSEDPSDFPKALMISSLEKSGPQAAWKEICKLAEWRREHGHWTARRIRQARYWFIEEVRHGLLAGLDRDGRVRDRMRTLGDDVAEGRETPSSAAARLLEELGESGRTAVRVQKNVRESTGRATP